MPEDTIPTERQPGRYHQARASVLRFWQRLHHRQPSTGTNNNPTNSEATAKAERDSVHQHVKHNNNVEEGSNSGPRRVRFADNSIKPEASPVPRELRHAMSYADPSTAATPPDSEADWAEFCKLCDGITIEALESDEGYTHVASAAELEATASECSLCYLLKMALNVSARRLTPEAKEMVKEMDIETDFEMLSMLAQKEASVSDIKRPLVLALYPGSMFRARELHVGMKFQDRLKDLPQTTKTHALDISFGMLFFHGEKEPVPLLPRLPDRDLFRLLEEQLWERSDDPRAREYVPLPSRVLDLKDTSRRPIYLNDDLSLTTGSGRRGEYATLSYCWGGYRGFLTERASFRDRMFRIKFHDLPKAFQDAVIVTRRLNIQYLWIDALCIIQDDKLDWEREASRMASIYRNCKVRIAATAITDPTQSFFPPKPIVASVEVTHLEMPKVNIPLKKWTIAEINAEISQRRSSRSSHDTERSSPEDVSSLIAYSDAGGAEHEIESSKRSREPAPQSSSTQDSEDETSEDGSSRITRLDAIEAGSLNSSNSRDSDYGSLTVEIGSTDHRKTEKCFITLPKYYAEDVDKAPLNSRAWVLQERLLAPDTIHFCEDHIYTESLVSVFGEDGKAQLFGFTSCIEKSRVGPSRLTQNNDDRGDHTSQSYNTDNPWLKIVEMYNECRITYLTDKLIAIAGLAEDRRTRGKYPYLGSKYGLGMWENTLPQDFLWASCSPQKLKFLNELHLPSWACIGYEGPFKFLNNGPRNIRDPYQNHVILKAEYHKFELIGPYESMQLPLQTSVLMSVRLKLLKVPRVGRKIGKLPDLLGHQEAFPSSPFRHSEGRKRPVALAAYSDCFELRDGSDELLGYLSMDTVEAPPAAELWCAQMATLHDPYPLKDQILSYCLIVIPTAEIGNGYRRVGIAEVKYDWICQAPAIAIKLV